jgi:hypothetical protein
VSDIRHILWEETTLSEMLQRVASLKEYSVTL